MGTQSINNLTQTDDIQNGDSLAIDRRSAGGDRKLPYADLIEALNEDLTFPGSDAKPEFVQQRESPPAGETVTVTDGSDDDSNIWLILTPSGTLATLTIKYPAVASVVNLQEILVFTTQAITTLTTDGNGAVDVIGEPTALAANESFKMKFDSQTKIWYNIQNPS
jgi:hypothetical protein